MFSKLLVSIGIGSAKVDARVPNEPVRPGDKLAGEIVIQGGNQEQEINAIYMAFEATYFYYSDGQTRRGTYELAKSQVADKLRIRAGETRVLPFEIEVPWETPFTTADQRVYLRTGLDIPRAIDPKDSDELEVLPDPLIEAMLAEAEELGFLHGPDSRRCSRTTLQEGLEFKGQAFHLRPTDAFRGQFTEVWVLFKAVSPQGAVGVTMVDPRVAMIGMLFGKQMPLGILELDRKSGYQPGSLEQAIRQAMKR